MKRILIFYTSVGLGHKIIAENIGWHLSHAGYDVRLEDILEVQSGPLVNLGTSLHQFVNKHLPFIWKFLYNNKIFTKLSLPLRVPLAAGNSDRAAQLIADFEPDLVITTQTTASAIVSHLKKAGDYQGKFAIAFSDYHFHPYWVYDNADFYLANIPEQKISMREQGIGDKKIEVCGITLKPRATVDTAEVLDQLGISPKAPVVLMASGSLGTGVTVSYYREFVDALKAKSPTARVVIVCGKNESLRHELETALSGTQAIVFGYFKPMAKLYAIADIFITKPGGLSVAESLQWQLPLLITHWLPGQEEHNYNYLMEKGLIMPVSTGVKPSELAEWTHAEISTHDFRESLQANSAWQDITQENRLGQAVISAINTLLK
jgi:processive 1,2-diacylglycerol beta-glucosyltransferase